MRFFNTEGPNRLDDHYSLPPLRRWDLDEILTLIDQKKYFLLHAPRQTGKTTCLLALMDHLNREGRYRALYVNIEAAQADSLASEASLRLAGLDARRAQHDARMLLGAAEARVEALSGPSLAQAEGAVRLARIGTLMDIVTIVRGES